MRKPKSEEHKQSIIAALKRRHLRPSQKVIDILKKSTKDTIWWNKDGINKRSKECPGFGWKSGRDFIPWNKKVNIK
jgi:hypothetical protein